LLDTKIIHALSPVWCENPDLIKKLIEQTEQFDQFRQQDWKKTFPEVAEFYRRYL
jgi:hypothetical protein